MNTQGVLNDKSGCNREAHQDDDQDGKYIH